MECRLTHELMTTFFLLYHDSHTQYTHIHTLTACVGFAYSQFACLCRALQKCIQRYGGGAADFANRPVEVYLNVPHDLLLAVSKDLNFSDSLQLQDDEWAEALQIFTWIDDPQDHLDPNKKGWREITRERMAWTKMDRDRYKANMLSMLSWPREQWKLLVRYLEAKCKPVRCN